MRLLMFTPGYPPRQNSGAEQQAARKVRWWTARGADVRVIATDPRPSEGVDDRLVTCSEEQRDGATVVWLDYSVPDARHSVLETYSPDNLAPLVEEEIATFAPDIVYQVSGVLFGLLPLEAADRHGIPSVLFATDFWHLCQRFTLLRPSQHVCPGPRHPADCAACRLTDRRPAKLLGERVNALAWRAIAGAGRMAPVDLIDVSSFAARERAVVAALSRVSLVIVNSRFLQEQMEKLGVSPERILRIRQGLDPDEVPAMRDAVRRMDAELRVLYLGQVTRHKGVDLLIDAAVRLRREGHDVRLRIFGPQTDQRIELPNLPRGNDDRIEMHAPLSRSEIAQELAASDVLVAPSRWYENSPNVILEAQAAGLPVVTADHGGMAEMVRHDIDGLLFAPGSAESLAAALRRLCVEPGLLDRLHAAVRAPHSVDVEMVAEEERLTAILTQRRSRAAASALSGATQGA